MQERKAGIRAPAPGAEHSGRSLLIALSLLVLSFAAVATSESQTRAHDPGPRAGSVGAGSPVSGLSAAQSTAFTDGMSRFVSVDSVSGTLAGEDDGGLGPRFNSNSCGSCHAQPATGGTSPSATAFPFVGPNPQVAVATLDGADNALPYFVHPDGPVREARFVNVVGANGRLTNIPDGGVHDLFTITGRTDATNAPGQFSHSQTCSLDQPNFNQMRALNNIIFRIPTPLFGAGMVENIPDEVILANMNANFAAKSQLGISGQPNRNGNDGTISRFGWKAQNKSLELFAGEAYNVEQGVSNEMFQNERAGPGEVYPRSCFFNGTPEDSTEFESNSPSDLVAFAAFMRFLDQPAPSANTPGGAQSIGNGRSLFVSAGCALCHTPQLPTGPSSLASGLNQVQANLFSDLLVHHMGTGLADGVSQGTAGPDQFRTSPLWGLGQRVFFLHDGRTSDLLQAIQQHSSSGSEANGVIHRFNQLSQSQQQDLLNFLRSL
ncbi:MAG TPA: di-heme oxidoredictase family protein [Candidatus Acidoferrales bacterium]|nr:di-heme oxidoredictase family protein [Candidatus Acidoferrales bacterium]